LERLIKNQKEYKVLVKNQREKLSKLGSILKEEGNRRSHIEARISDLEKARLDVKAAVREEEETLLRGFVDLANRNLSKIRGEDDWFLMPDENRLRIVRAIKEDRKTRLVKKKFTSASPLLHEGLRLSVCLSVSLAIVEMRIKSETNNLSFMIIDSPDSVLANDEMNKLLVLLEQKKMIQVLILTSRRDLSDNFKTIAKLDKNPSVLSRKKLSGIEIEESDKSSLDYWGIWK
jgi:hypothetical protein